MARHLAQCLNRMSLLKNCTKGRLFLSSTRNLSNVTATPDITKQKKINIDYEDPPEFKEFWKDARCGKNSAVESLMEMLNVTRAIARNTVEEYPNIKMLTRASLHANYLHLREIGFESSTIIDNAFLLTMETQELKDKSSLMKNLGIDMIECVHFFKLSLDHLQRFVLRLKFEEPYFNGRTRIHYLAEKLQRSLSDVCRLLSYYPFVLTLHAPKLVSVTEYILEIGMKPEHVFKDPNIYSYSLPIIKEKVELAKAANIYPIKPWIIRTTSTKWEKERQRTSDRIKAIGDATLEEYLAKMFDTDIQVVHFLFSKNSMLRRKRPEKLIRVAKLFQSNGYDINDILRAPNVLSRKYETLVELFELSKQFQHSGVHISYFMYDKINFLKRLQARLEKLLLSKHSD